MYKKFFLMLLVSFIVMYGVMFLNVDDTSHIHLSLTRIYMALLMVTPMAVMMILMMGKMYTDKRLNGGILIASCVVFIAALFCLRNQTAIGDSQYMKAMIPHHSSAILTSKNANLKDPEVKKLAEDIIQAQKEEIAQMENILKRMENK